ncbi:MAG: DUF4278 domain-containing protein [Microcystaceae cyanobacterium]
MKLTYRGISYQYTPPVETHETQVAGKYRGLDWRFRNLQKPPVLQPRANLTYRGVTYNPTVATEKPVKETVAVTSTQDKARLLMLKQSKNMMKRQRTLLNRLAAEIGLDMTDSDYENRIQGKIHPTFRQDYSRHGAAMS